MILKAESSVGSSIRLYWKARSMQRAEQERREQEEVVCEDARRKEIDALYRLAEEETAAALSAAVPEAFAAVGQAPEKHQRNSAKGIGQQKTRYFPVLLYKTQNTINQSKGRPAIKLEEEKNNKVRAY